MIDVPDKLLAAFRVEHREHLHALRAMLDELAERDFDATGFDFAEAYRRVHNLKGASRAVGLRPLENLAHLLESVMARCQSGALALEHEVAVVVQLALDGFEDFAAAAVEGAQPGELAETTAAVERLLGAAPAGAPQAKPVVFAADQTAAAIETARVDVDSLDAVLKRAGEVLAAGRQNELIAAELGQLRRGLELLSRRKRGRHEAPSADDLDRLTALAEQSKEIERVQRDAAWRMGALGRQLYRDVRALRIVPADSVFGGTRKMLRDLAQGEGKQVEIKIDGLDTRADRKVLQVLKDPVMHLLRNAVGHGIELPQLRTRQGKTPAGRIGFALARQGNHLVVRIADDGVGLDRARIADEAARRGLLPSGEAPPSSPEALTRLLLLPGFTTTRAVTEIAGRGIGLAVVDKAVRQLQGRFALSPAAPYGTIATITVPLVVAGHRLLLVRCGSHLYGIPAETVRRLYRLAPDDIMTVNGTTAVMPQGYREPLRLASLAALLGLSDGAAVGDDGKLQVVMLALNGAVLCVAVDACTAVQDAVIHDLDAAVPGVVSVMGAIIQEDGSVVTVLNPAALVAASAETPRGRIATLRAAPRREAKPLILVVDDSITTRTLEKSILEASGFRVRLSVDGVDALEQLDRELPDLVIVDIEMPRMNGFELLHAMKGDQRLAELPVVLVTSRDDEADRRMGLALGAKAYIVKQRFDQRALLETIEQIL